VSKESEEDTMETRQEKREKRRKGLKDKMPRHGASSLHTIQQVIVKRSQKDA